MTFSLVLAGMALAQNTAVDAKWVEKTAQVVLGISSYVQWPVIYPELKMCVAGEAKYAGLLLGNTFPGQRIQVQRVALDGTIFSSGCNILYLGAVNDVGREKLFWRLAGRPILTITEVSVPCGVSSMFCLKFQNDQLVYEVNLDAIGRSGLRLHPNVLLLAKKRAP